MLDGLRSRGLDPVLVKVPIPSKESLVLCIRMTIRSRRKGSILEWPGPIDPDEAKDPCPYLPFDLLASEEMGYPMLHRSGNRIGPKVLLFLLFPILFSGFLSAQNEPEGAWGKLLQEHVTEQGYLDYEGVQEERKLFDRALESLRVEMPEEGASDQERIAYWINVYNAFAIQLVLDHYPTESIRDIDRAFERTFIDIDGESYSLNDIEKGILLENFEDPRIHYAVNCASISCPPLRGEPYRARTLDRQLEDQAARFVNDPSKNKLGKDRVRISKLYDWYREDFTRNGSLVDHLNRYAKGVRIEADASLSFMEYDWGLNQNHR